jgi:hypothetical protein
VKWDLLPARRGIADGRIWRNFGAVVNRPSPAAAQNHFTEMTTPSTWICNTARQVYPANVPRALGCRYEIVRRAFQRGVPPDLAIAIQEISA